MATTSKTSKPRAPKKVHGFVLLRGFDSEAQANYLHTLLGQESLTEEEVIAKFPFVDHETNSRKFIDAIKKDRITRMNVAPGTSGQRNTLRRYAAVAAEHGLTTLATSTVDQADNMSLMKGHLSDLITSVQAALKARGIAFREEDVETDPAAISEAAAQVTGSPTEEEY